MSLPRSHPLHQQLLRFSQVMLHRHWIWRELRQAAYDLRDRHEEISRKQIKSARAAGDCVLALTIEEQRARVYLKEKAVIDGFNFNVPVDVTETTHSDVEVLQHQALLATPPNQISTASEIFDPAEKLAAYLAILVAEVPPPPGESIRSTPRRPGAPSALLPH